MALKGPPGDYIAFQVGFRIDNPTYRLLGFENKFSPSFEFETSAKIDLQ